MNFYNHLYLLTCLLFLQSAIAWGDAKNPPPTGRQIEFQKKLETQTTISLAIETASKGDYKIWKGVTDVLESSCGTYFGIRCAKVCPSSEPFNQGDGKAAAEYNLALLLMPLSPIALLCEPEEKMKGATIERIIEQIQIQSGVTIPEWDEKREKEKIITDFLRAARDGNIEYIKSYTGNINVYDAGGNTALDYASKFDQTDTKIFLKSKGGKSKAELNTEKK